MSISPEVSQSNQLTEAITWLEAALSQLHSAEHASVEQRKAAEVALLQFQRSDGAWSLCLHLLQHSQQTCTSGSASNLLLFAAQTLRTKINEQGSSLAPDHSELLKQAILQQLMNPAVQTAVLRQLCLALASLAALMPDWGSWLQSVGVTLPLRNAVQLLLDVAEEGSTDWRHVTVPGLTSSEKLSWATTTRERFRSWSPDALQLLHLWLQQQQQQQQQVMQGTMCLLECLTAWVKLGCLHVVSPQLAVDTAQVGLVHIQSPNPEVVSAALGFLLEVPEFAPEHLIRSLEPHMLQVAAAAVRAATGGVPDLMHAPAWVSAFSAYAAAVPHMLLAAGEEEGSGGEDLRQALLQVAGLAHIHNTQLVCLPALHVWSNVLGHESPAAAARFSAAGGGCGGLSRASTAAEPVDVGAAAEEANSLAALTGDTAAEEPHKVPACIVNITRQLALQTAVNCMLWAKDAEGQEAAGTLEATTAVQAVFLAVCCVLGPRQYLQCVLNVAGANGQHLRQQQPLLQEAVSLQPVLQCLSAAPSELRLPVAVEMAAAAAVVQLPADPGAAVDEQDCASIAALLSQAAAQVNQQALHSTDTLRTQLTLSFCKAIQVWAHHLAYHLTVAQQGQGVDDMGALLQLLVGIASQEQAESSSTRHAAAAAVRALTSAALHLGWDKLYLGSPLLLQAVQHLSGVDSADQDLFASLSMCLAAVGAPTQELQDLRVTSSQQLVQPVVQHLDVLLQQLQAGQQWAVMGRSADAQLSQHMVRVRVVLEAAWQHQEHQHRVHAGPYEGQHDRELTDDDVAQAGVDMDDAGWLDHAGGDQHSTQQRSGVDPVEDPAVQLVLTQLWAQLHALVVQHAAAGKFLQHYAKCCSKLLKLRPELLLRPQQQLLQFLEVSVLGLVRPGGSCLAEPLLSAVELCCQQQGATLLLETVPCINQAFVQLWSLPQVLALQQPGQGDAQPDLTEAVMKLSTAWVKHNSILQPSTSQLASVLPCVVAAVAACARCCHKKVGSCALVALLALLSAASGAAESGPQQQLQETVAAHAALLAFGALGALLVPSPLPRLQKVSSVLLELAVLASQVDQSSMPTQGLQHLCVGGSMLAAAPFTNQQPATTGTCTGAAQAAATGPQATLHMWLALATSGFVPVPLSATEAAELAAACAGLLVSTAQHAGAGEGSSSSSRARQVPASRSYVAARRLKKRLRDFAERHMRTCAAHAQ